MLLEQLLSVSWPTPRNANDSWSYLYMDASSESLDLCVYAEVL